MSPKSDVLMCQAGGLNSSHEKLEAFEGFFFLKQETTLYDYILL